MHSFTKEDLIRFLYRETSAEQTAAIQTAISSDWNLREEFELLSSGFNQLEKITMAPRKQTVDYILNYAEKGVEELSPHA